MDKCGKNVILNGDDFNEDMEQDSQESYCDAEDTKGSRAQEEAICRCSTLYPVLNTKENWSRFYKFHRDRHDAKYTDTCIYTHDILIIKSDTDIPRRLPEDNWCKVDVITCAAPNLRERPGNAMNPSPGNQVLIKLFPDLFIDGSSPGSAMVKYTYIQIVVDY